MSEPGRFGLLDLRPGLLDLPLPLDRLLETLEAGLFDLERFFLCECDPHEQLSEATAAFVAPQQEAKDW